MHKPIRKFPKLPERDKLLFGALACIAELDDHDDIFFARKVAIQAINNYCIRIEEENKANQTSGE